MRSRSSVVSILTLMAAFGVHLPAQNLQQLEGTYILAFEDSTPQGTPSQPGIGLIQFTAGGGVSEQLNTVGPPGSMTTHGLGEWERSGPAEFQVTIIFAAAVVDQTGGHPIGYFKQRMKLTFASNRKDLSGTFKWALLDLNGNPLFGGEGTVTLKRVAVDPL